MVKNSCFWHENAKVCKVDALVVFSFGFFFLYFLLSHDLTNRQPKVVSRYYIFFLAYLLIHMVEEEWKEIWDAFKGILIIKNLLKIARKQHLFDQNKSKVHMSAESSWIYIQIHERQSHCYDLTNVKKHIKIIQDDMHVFGKKYLCSHDC